MKDEADLIPLSALAQFLWCQRRCALIHIEQAWAENQLTAEGRIMHETAHDETSKQRGSLRIETGVSLYSKRLGLNGKADVVEFHKSVDGKWMPFPVEYKRGKPKDNDCDNVQLCAQAMCLEEMLDVCIPEGAIFYGKTKRRFQVVFDQRLRSKTEETAKAVHEFISAGMTPKPIPTKKCKSCSLEALCMPKTFEKSLLVEKYVKKVLTENEETA